MKKYKKVISSVLLIVCLCAYAAMAMGSSNSSDPDVKAYDDNWLIHHNLDGSPR